MELKHLLHIAEIIDSYFQELSSVLTATGIEAKVILNYIRNLCSVGFKLNNLVPLDRHNFTLFCSYI